MSFQKSVKTFHTCLEINRYFLEELIPKIFENAALNIFPLFSLPSSFLQYSNFLFSKFQETLAEILVLWKRLVIGQVIDWAVPQVKLQTVGIYNEVTKCRFFIHLSQSNQVVPMYKVCMWAAELGSGGPLT